MTPEQIAGEKLLLEKTIEQLTKAIAEIDKGLAKAQQALPKLQAGQAKLTDAEQILQDLRRDRLPGERRSWRRRRHRPGAA